MLPLFQNKMPFFNYTNPLGVQFVLIINMHVIIKIQVKKKKTEQDDYSPRRIRFLAMVLKKALKINHVK